MSNLKLVGISGSLRKDSYNTIVLKYIIGKLSSENIDTEILDMSNIPPYNQDIETNMPESVKAFKEGIKNSDGVVIVSPEYNRAMPGVLKNAIDWASRPHGDNSFNGKKVLLTGASIGSLGTAVMQYTSKIVFSFLDCYVLDTPQVFISDVSNKVKDGKLVDEETIKRLDEMIAAFIDFLTNPSKL